MMGVQDDILSTFLEKLKEEKNIPLEIIEKLEELEKDVSLWTKDAVLEIIKGEVNVDNENQEP